MLPLSNLRDIDLEGLGTEFASAPDMQGVADGSHLVKGTEIRCGLHVVIHISQS